MHNIILSGYLRLAGQNAQRLEGKTLESSEAGRLDNSGVENPR
jgi:hypothetical protein